MRVPSYDWLVSVRHDCVLGGLGFNFHVYFSSGLELHFLPIVIHKLVGNPNFLVQVVCSLDGDLGFLRFS